MTVADVRDLVSPENPFALGSYPERPAPAHLMNGFLAAALGVSPRSAQIRKLIASSAQPSDFSFFDGTEWDRDHFTNGVAWARDPRQLATFRNDLARVFNPDRRMWAQIGSPMPVHAVLVANDPSDERLGPLVWELVRHHVDDGYRDRLEQLFRPETAHDPVTATALVLAGGAGEGPLREINVSESAWFGDGGNAPGQELARSLASFINALTVPTSDSRRLLQIQHLSRGIYLAALIALLLGPIATAATDESSASGVDSIAQMVVWAGTPPGSSGNPMVMSAARSFHLIVERNRAALPSGLAEGLDGQPLPSGLPVAQARRTALRAHLLESGMAANRVAAAMERIARDAGVSIDGESPGDPAWATSVIESVYSADFLTRGLRSMGRKLGFIGPDRGAGVPRFLCETPLLGTIVAGLCPLGGTDFETFIDSTRERLGLVFGLGTHDSLAEELGLWEGAGVGRQMLRDNQESLRQRLVRSGLAREYSDGHTEVYAGG